MMAVNLSFLSQAREAQDCIKMLQNMKYIYMSKSLNGYLLDFNDILKMWDYLLLDRFDNFKYLGMSSTNCKLIRQKNNHYCLNNQLLIYMN